MSTEKLAEKYLTDLEAQLTSALKLANVAHLQVMRASESIGERHNTGAAHACLGLMEISLRALRQSNDAARYARHALRYPA